MSCEGWTEKTLGEVTHWTSGGTPSKSNESFWGGDIPWISANVMKSNRIYSSELYITEKGLENGSRLAGTGSILLLVRGSELHKRIPVCKALVPVSFNQDVKALKPKAEIDSNFLLYWFLANEPLILNKVESTGIGAGKLDTKLMMGLEFKYPPLPEQRAIARILTSLDDKIELNNRMNKTLEEMAQTIFKRWFVDFEFPDENGNPYKSSGGKMVESELGMIPEGWRVGTAKHLLLRKGKSFTPSSNNKEIKYIGLEHMPQKSISLNSWGNSSDVTSTKSYFEKGDILFGKLRPYFHKVGIAPVDGICSTDILVLNSVNKDFYGYAVCLVSSTEYVKFADSASEGTKMPRAKWSHMETYSIVIPIVEISKMFNNIVIPMYAKIIENIHATNTLSQLRDTLIPRLMSGEIRINI